MTLQIHMEWIRIQKWSAIIDCKLFYDQIVHYVLSLCVALIFTKIVIEEVCCFGQKHSY